jgi:hypothetical protein
VVILINPTPGIVIERKSFMLFPIDNPVTEDILPIMQFRFNSIFILTVSAIFHIEMFGYIYGNHLVRVDTSSL